MAVRLIGGFLVALAGAQLALWLKLPLPWMLGALLATAATRIAGVRTACAAPLRNAGQWVIGTSLGLYFTPQVVGHIGENAGAIVAGMLLALLLCCLGSWLLQRLGGQDFQTAWFASAIGGASEMASLAERYGARIERVATAHSLRVLMVVLIVPFAFQWSGIAGLDPTVPGPGRVHYPGLAWLVALTCLAAALFAWRRWPSPWVMGPLLCALALTAQGIELSALPPAFLNAGQLLVGWSLGDRYRPGFFRTAPRFLAVVMLYTLLSLGVALALAWALSFFSPVPLPTLVLGTTPGGIAEMAITAKVLQLGVPVVTAFHVTRMVFVVMVTGPLYVYLSRRKSAS
ncbi:AbrB family transcriptional regulator [Orrella sp. JC864]|uniref:AbrB family transcriptional regulator n=1 Tax=Orrella sp. JC864 TaxID=3120298 RepID=UPI0030089BA3